MAPGATAEVSSNDRARPGGESVPRDLALVANQATDSRGLTIDGGLEHDPSGYAAEMAQYDAAVAGGRRAITALFADVAGSTALASRLDPEDVAEVVGVAVQRFCEVVERFGGSVKDVAGDGVLAFFGTPYAHEDDPERAVLAGLEIQRAVEEHADTVASGPRGSRTSASGSGSRPASW